MSQRFLKFIPSELTDWLIIYQPSAFKLLYFIAKRARRTPNSPDGLNPGECFIGDWEAIKMTRGEYRHALDILTGKKIIQILETNRTRKKATTGTTTTATKVKLLNSDIWDINIECNNHQSDHPTTTEQPLNNHKQETKETKDCFSVSLEETFLADTAKIEKEPQPFETDRFYSSLTQEEMLCLKMIYADCVENKWDVTRDDINLWIKCFGIEKVLLTIDYVKNRKTGSVIDHVNYIQKALSGDYVGREKREEEGRELVIKYKKLNDLDYIIPMKQYFKVKDTNDQYFYNKDLKLIEDDLNHVRRKYVCDSGDEEGNGTR